MKNAQFEFETMIKQNNSRSEADIYRKKLGCSYDSIERINTIVERVMEKNKKGEKNEVGYDAPIL